MARRHNTMAAFILAMVNFDNKISRPEINFQESLLVAFIVSPTPLYTLHRAGAITKMILSTILFLIVNSFWDSSNFMTPDFELSFLRAIGLGQLFTSVRKILMSR